MAFDIDRYAATSERVAFDDLDLDHFRAHPLPPATLRTLHYMTEVEYHTVCYTRDLLTTRRTASPRSARSSRCGTARSSGTAKRSPPCSQCTA